MTKQVLCRVDDLSPSQPMIQVNLDNYPPLAVYLTDGGEVFCTNDTCTHAEGSLSEGDLNGYRVECPFHGGAFDIRTGQPVDGPCYVPLKTYRIEVDSGEILMVGALGEDGGLDA